MRRFLIAGTGSGCGKTTVTCAILQALVSRGVQTASFKCGPDYIDPMFHREVIGTPAHNLDPFFCSGQALCELLARYGSEVNVLEGVMGLYDGGDTSAHAVSMHTQTPVILVINCRGMSDSIGAVMQGFLRYQAPNRIAGFIFNRLPEKLIPLAKRLCEELGTQYFGCLPNAPTFESRHLGLVTAQEIGDLRQKLHALGELAERCIDLDALLSLEAAALPAFTPLVPSASAAPCVIAVARDSAFCFTYAENLDVWRDMGCEIRFFSPLTDGSLPECDGLYLPGGYPELHAKALSRNVGMRADIRAAIRSGMPVIAECGGFLYLHETLTVSDGETYPMVGCIPGNAYPMGRLQRFGYITMTAQTDSLLCRRGAHLTAHEFHYWESEHPGTAFHAVKPDGRTWDCAHAGKRLYAGFPHLYWYEDRTCAERFVRACKAFREEQHETHSNHQSP